MKPEKPLYARSVNYNGIKLLYDDYVNGGGTWFGQDFVPAVKERIGKVNTIYEWCCGPAFIAFNLLSNDLCNELVLSDINPDIQRYMYYNLKNNNISRDKVRLYITDCVDFIPYEEKFDLVVANPPHINVNKGNKRLRSDDIGWKIHQKFYDDISHHLNSNSKLLIQERKDKSSIDDFKPMIEENDFKIIDVFNGQDYKDYYFILMEKGE